MSQKPGEKRDYQTEENDQHFHLTLLSTFCNLTSDLVIQMKLFSPKLPMLSRLPNLMVFSQSSAFMVLLRYLVQLATLSSWLLSLRVLVILFSLHLSTYLTSFSFSFLPSEYDSKSLSWALFSSLSNFISSHEFRDHINADDSQISVSSPELQSHSLPTGPFQTGCLTGTSNSKNLNQKSLSPCQTMPLPNFPISFQSTPPSFQSPSSQSCHPLLPHIKSIAKSCHLYPHSTIHPLSQLKGATLAQILTPSCHSLPFNFKSLLPHNCQSDFPKMWFCPCHSSQEI